MDALYLQTQNTVEYLFLDLWRKPEVSVMKLQVCAKDSSHNYLSKTEVLKKVKDTTSLKFINILHILLLYTTTLLQILRDFAKKKDLLLLIRCTLFFLLSRITI